MASLLRTVVAGPRDRGGDLPQYADVFGQVSVGGTGMWSFRSVTEKGRDAGKPAPVWHLRRGFGSTEPGLIQVGLTLALAHRPGAASDLGQAVIRRRRLDPGQDVVVVPELMDACRGLKELPLALVVTSAEECDTMLTELAAATGWSVTAAVISRR
ncbi:MAG: hypothetical protein IPK37_02985 [Austwickia sp.]|jgi:hypothetical protein|nr:MAG: hypothetical protein IPK37_02985 [Austwickia sp.]